jgi:hypothetical protein
MAIAADAADFCHFFARAGCHFLDRRWHFTSQQRGTIMTSLGLNRFAHLPLAAAGLLLAFTALAPAPAAAQQGTMSPEQACQGDAFRLCNDFIPDRTKVGACLRRNARSLSADCRTFVVGGGRHYTRHGHARVYHRTRHTQHHK